MASIETNPLTKQDSDLALIWDTDENLVAGVPTISSRWDSKGISLSVKPYDANDPAFLNGLSSNKGKINVTFKTNTAVCRVLENVRRTEGGQSFWDLNFRIMNSDFSPDIEMSFAGISAEELAVMRAKRILLNENPAPKDLNNIKDINQLTRELFIGGQGTSVRVQSSPFPDLFRRFSANRERFLDLAWINAIMHLKLSATVETIELLQLTLRGDVLHVEFRGKRKRKFSNVPPFSVSFSGICPLRG